MKRVPEKFEFRPIGVARTPFKEPRGAPIQPVAAENARGEIEIYAEFAEGLLDIEGFSHIVVLYAFHLSEGYNLTPKPFLEDVTHGVFAVRAPKRPNPIGMSVVRLLERRGNVLVVENPDFIDGTPILDIKPHVPEFDAPKGNVRIGWLEKRVENARSKKADDRFLNTE